MHRNSIFGHIIGENGVRPDPSKVQAISDMPEFENVKELQTFLRMSNYLSRFTPRLSSLSTPLRYLCKKDSEFQWGPENNKAFTGVKEEISRATNLQCYDRKEAVDSASRCVHSWSRSCFDPRQRTSGLCVQRSDGD